ncbi:MAG: VWA domain-containing protein [Deltaproteobacteria bacterium]|nr:VWA domain-containing protein [Deltaproteobacteria bacterium]
MQDGPSEFAPLEPLRQIDLEVFRAACAMLSGRTVPEDRLALIAEEAASALLSERRFGRLYTEGLARLALSEPDRAFFLYVRLVRGFAKKGSTLAAAVASGASFILAAGDFRLLSLFIRAVIAMNRQGAHALARPVEGLVFLMEDGDLKAASAFCRLLSTAFGRTLTYHQTLELTQILPYAAKNLLPRRRAFQFSSWEKAAQASAKIPPAFADGLTRGLSILGPDGLDRFVTEALDLYGRNAEAGLKFFALETFDARNLAASLSTSVPLSRARQDLARYLRARLGRVVPVKGLSALSAGDLSALPREVSVTNDGSGLFFMEEMDIGPNPLENLSLYKALARVEAGLIEFETYDFDAGIYNFYAKNAGIGLEIRTGLATEPDLDRFFAVFANPLLIRGLFTIFEHARIRFLLLRRYPGMEKTSFELLRKYAGAVSDRPPTALDRLYRVLALGDAPEFSAEDDPLSRSIAMFGDACRRESFSVEDSALLAARLYPDWEKFLAISPEEDAPALAVPFGRAVYPRLAWTENCRKAELLRQKLAELGIDVYRKKLAALLGENGGNLSKEELAKLVPDPAACDAAAKELGLDDRPSATCDDAPDGAAVFRYPEWDEDLADLLPDHCRVAALSPAAGDVSLYSDVLVKRSGLLTGIRKNFEMLKPQGLVLLRRVPDGDDLSLTSVVEHVVERRAGRVPRERIYTRRVRKLREVSVLLLADVSRSTGNVVPGGFQTVLDVEKEALVLFCEALTSVGDEFSLAAFSGAGRLRVDYLTVKDFGEGVTDDVKGRLSNLTPSRNTRMGAAVRHASAMLAARQNRVKLLIILSDGFPNDLEYKGNYAIADTRRSIREAKAKNIAVHAVTVNLSDAARLDEIYGEVGHTLISDVTDLPEKLVGLYRRLTR